MLLGVDDPLRHGLLWRAVVAVPFSTRRFSMTTRGCLFLVAVLGVLGSTSSQAQPAAAGDGGLGERIAAIKQSLAVSQQNLRTYQWIETTAVSLNGEEKSRTQNTCYYGADGNLQKVPLSATPPPA